MQTPRCFPHLALLLLVFGAMANCTQSAASSHAITILAASSLTEAITEIADAYEADHPGARIISSFAGSQILAAQILEGARFDLFCSADELQMGRVADDVSDPITFATSRLVVITPTSADHPNALAALTNAKHIAMAAPEVPAGRYTRDVCEQLGIWDAVEPKARALEESVRAVLTRVALGEADAGIVYASDTDAAPPDSIRVYEFSESVTVKARYLAAINNTASDQSSAQAFLHFLVTDEQALRILRTHRFSAP